MPSHQRSKHKRQKPSNPPQPLPKSTRTSRLRTSGSLEKPDQPSKSLSKSLLRQPQVLLRPSTGALTNGTNDPIRLQETIENYQREFLVLETRYKAELALKEQRLREVIAACLNDDTPELNRFESSLDLSPTLSNFKRSSTQPNVPTLPTTISSSEFSVPVTTDIMVEQRMAASTQLQGSYNISRRRPPPRQSYRKRQHRTLL